MSKLTIIITSAAALLLTASSAHANWWEKNCEAMADFKVYIGGLYQGACVCDASVVNPNLEVGQLTVSPGEGLKPHGDGWNENLCYVKQGMFEKDRTPRVGKSKTMTTTVPGLVCYAVGAAAPLTGVCGNIFHIKVDLSGKLEAKGMVWGEFAASVKYGFEGKGYRGKFWSKEDGTGVDEMPKYKITSEANANLPSWSKATLTQDFDNKTGSDLTNWYATATGTTNMAVTIGTFLQVDAKFTGKSPWVEKAGVSFAKQTFCGQFDIGLGHVALAHATGYNCTAEPATVLTTQQTLDDVLKKENLPAPGTK